MCAWAVDVELLKGDKRNFVGEMCVRTDVHENHTNTESNRKKQLRKRMHSFVAGSGHVRCKKLYFSLSTLRSVGLGVCPICWRLM